MPLSQPIQTYRGTWDELMSRRDEIAPNAVLEVKVYQPDSSPRIDEENQTLISLLQSWREEDATDNAEEMERRDTETDALMNNLQASRLSLRGPEV